MSHDIKQKDEHEFLHEKPHLLVKREEVQLFTQDIIDNSKSMHTQKQISQNWFLIGLFGTLLFFFITVLFTFAFAYLFYSSVSDRKEMSIQYDNR